jgi:hypothetical protein
VSTTEAVLQKGLDLTGRVCLPEVYGRAVTILALRRINPDLTGHYDPACVRSKAAKSVSKVLFSKTFGPTISASTPVESRNSNDSPVACLDERKVIPALHRRARLCHAAAAAHPTRAAGPSDSARGVVQLTSSSIY